MDCQKFSDNLQVQQVDSKISAGTWDNKNASMTRSGASSLASLQLNQSCYLLFQPWTTTQNQSMYWNREHGSKSASINCSCMASVLLTHPHQKALTAGSVLSSWQWECPFHQCLPLPFLPLPSLCKRNIGQQLGSCESRAKRLQRKDFTLQSGMQCTSVLSLLKCIVPHCGSKGMLHTREWHSASREKGV